MVYAWLEWYLLLAMLAFAGGLLLPKGNSGTSAKRALSLLLLLYAAKPVARLLGAV